MFNLRLQVHLTIRPILHERETHGTDPPWRLAADLTQHKSPIQ